MERRLTTQAIFLFLFLKESQQGSNEKRLLHELFEKRYYSPLERPVENESMPIRVNFTLVLQQIIDVDEKNQIIHTNIWLQMKWKAANLMWDPYEYGGIEAIPVPAKLIWTPDILLYNRTKHEGNTLAFPIMTFFFQRVEKKLEKKSVGFDIDCDSSFRILERKHFRRADDKFDGTYHSNVVLKSDGSCLWVPPGMLRSTCSIDITWFPFDDQHCDLKFGSWTYDGRMLDLQMDDPKGGSILEFRRNGEWELIGVPGHRHVQDYDCCPEFYIDLVYTIHIRRRTLYYGFNIIIPCLLISSMSLLLFLLPPDAGEKISLGVTILLSLMVFLLLVAETMPPTSDALPLIGIYFCCIMVMTSLSVLFTVVVLNFHYRGPETHLMPSWVKFGINVVLAKALCMSRPITEKRRQSIIQRHRLGDIQMHERTTTHSLLPNLLESEEEYRTCAENGIRGVHNLGTSDWIRQTQVNAHDCGVTQQNEEETERMRHFAEKSDHFGNPNLVAILGELKKITSKLRQDEEDNNVRNEWKFAAIVIDRLCLWICLAATLISTIAILSSAPHLVA